MKVMGEAVWEDSILDGVLSEPGASGADLTGLQRPLPENFSTILNYFEL